jgi:BlaI family transcriptional regulator, penicillinase repressor
MEENASPHPGIGPRHAILDLAPLELECMNALWPVGESTVREIHRQLAAARPRAYTTVMTIMDRLAQKGVVTRRKVGRAYRYQPNLSVDQARMNAVEKIVAGFFHGSAEALAAHVAALETTTRPAAPLPERPEPGRRETPPERAPGLPGSPTDGPDASEPESAPQGLDERLL